MANGRYSLVIPPDLDQEIRDCANDLGFTLSQFIRYCIKLEVERLKEKKK